MDSTMSRPLPPLISYGRYQPARYRLPTPICLRSCVSIVPLIDRLQHPAITLPLLYNLSPLFNVAVGLFPTASICLQFYPLSKFYVN